MKKMHFITKLFFYYTLTAQDNNILMASHLRSLTLQNSAFFKKGYNYHIKA
jgi:hypothetical protein